MRFSQFIVLFVIFTLAVSIALPAFSADGAAIYKAKCAACHGPEGQGKVGPAVKSTNLAPDQIVDVLTKAPTPRRLRTKNQSLASRLTMPRQSRTTSRL